MPCYSPLKGYRARFVNDNGKRPIVFNPNDGYTDMPVTVPCGRCIGCRLEYSRQWAVRCVHEASLHEHNAFITLTYDNEHLPADNSIHKTELQKFFKRLRKNIGQKIRYFACGEYGEMNNRPHYHAIIFGYDFPDKKLHTKRNGNLLFTSQELQNSWNLGHSLIGAVTFESAAYVARYVTKKYKSKDQSEIDQHYQLCDRETGEIFQLTPEFCLMSRRPGIGKDWLEKYKSDTDKDFITLSGKKMSLPKYYDSLLEKDNQEEFAKRKLKRKQNINKEDNTAIRLMERETCKKAQITQLNRDLEDL